MFEVQKKRGPAAARRLLVTLFLSAACQAEDTPSEEQFFDAWEDLYCEYQVACGRLENQSQCSSDLGLGACQDYHPESANACLDAIERAIDEAAPGDAASCPNAYGLDACAETITNRTDGDCGTTAGRPLLIDGEAVLPRVLGSGREQGRAPQHWLACARTEAASVPAFERLAAELEHLGAPSTLSQAAHEAAQDEVRHAALCLEQANSLGRADYTLEPLPCARPRRDVTLETLAVEALLEGCIGEGSAAAWASIAREGAGATARTVLSTIAADELRHAVLSWRVLGWALRRAPSLATTLRATLDHWERSQPVHPPQDDRVGLREYGILSLHEERAITLAQVTSVVRPTLEALCGSPAAYPNSVI